MSVNQLKSMAIVPINIDNVCDSLVAEHARLPSSAEHKAQWRRELLARRVALTPEQRQQRSAQLTRELRAWLTEQLEPTAAIALYWPFKGEIDLQALMEHWCGQGGRVYLPIVHQANAPLQFASYRGLDAMRKGAYGILEPIYEPSELTDRPADLAVLFAPCIGFNAQGYRLGYGGGYYDRTLASWRANADRAMPITVGVADASAQIDFAPDRYDLPLDYLCLAENY